MEAQTFPPLFPLTAPSFSLPHTTPPSQYLGHHCRPSSSAAVGSSNFLRACEPQVALAPLTLPLGIPNSISGSPRNPRQHRLHSLSSPSSTPWLDLRRGRRLSHALRHRCMRPITGDAAPLWPPESMGRALWCRRCCLSGTGGSWRSPRSTSKATDVQTLIGVGGHGGARVPPSGFHYRCRWVVVGSCGCGDSVVWESSPLFSSRDQSDPCVIGLRVRCGSVARPPMPATSRSRPAALPDLSSSPSDHRRLPHNAYSAPLAVLAV